MYRHSDLLVCLFVCSIILVAFYHIIMNRDDYCLSNALHSSIGQNIKSHPCPLSGHRYPVSVLRPECEKLQGRRLTFRVGYSKIKHNQKLRI